MTSKIILGIGSNLGDRLELINGSISRIKEEIGLIKSISPLYETEPIGFKAETSFLNLCLAVETELNPENVIKKIQEIELDLGRTRNEDGSYSSRTIDIDIILWGSIEIDTENIKIPHPRFRERLFVLKPLNDIAPSIVDPTTNMTITKLLSDCIDKSVISIYE